MSFWSLERLLRDVLLIRRRAVSLALRFERWQESQGKKGKH